MDTMSTATTYDDNHLDTWRDETAALAPTAWEHWIDAVEAHLGHGVDGNQDTDGFSIDNFFDLHREGMTVAEAVSRAKQDIRAVRAAGHHDERVWI